MRIVFVHHHLRRGGVTRVMRQAVEAVQGQGVDVAVLTGEPPPDRDAWSVPVVVVEGLGYTDPQQRTDPADLEHRLRAAAREALEGDPDVWHWHNHSLGKNPAATAAVARLAEAGEAMVLQIHDFAEDGRPGNYVRLAAALEPPLRLYPHAPRVVTAPINGRDHGILSRAGLPEASLAPLPNAVGVPTSAFPAGDPEYVLYPTRAIGRKNIGELLLWAGWLRDITRFGVTLAPENPAEQPTYDLWRQLAASAGLPIEWEVGASGRPFNQIMLEAGAVITTSMAEGFGLAFLEPWGMGRPVVGRNLPEITADFVEAGVVIDGLYDHVDVPVHTLPGAWEIAFRQGWKRVVEAYGRPGRAEEMDGELDRLREAGRVDFGRLSPGLQQGALPGLWSLPAPDLGHRAWSPEQIALRAQVIGASFGPEAYGQRLLGLWEQVAGAAREPVQWLDPDPLLDAFLDPTIFTLLRAR